MQMGLMEVVFSQLPSWLIDDWQATILDQSHLLNPINRGGRFFYQLLAAWEQIACTVHNASCIMHHAP